MLIPFGWVLTADIEASNDVCGHKQHDIVRTN